MATTAHGPDRPEIHDPFAARHRVTGAILALLGLVLFGVVVGLAVGSVLARVLDLVLSVVGGGTS